MTSRLLPALLAALVPAAALAHHPEEGGAMLAHAMEIAPVVAVLALGAAAVLHLRRRR